MVRCSVKKCKSDSERKIKGISFHRFPPDDDDIFKLWVAATRRVGWVPKNHSRICSLHFDNDSLEKSNKKTYLNPTAVPNTVAEVQVKTKNKIEIKEEFSQSDDDSMHTSPNVDTSSDLLNVKTKNKIKINEDLSQSDDDSIHTSSNVDTSSDLLNHVQSESDDDSPPAYATAFTNADSPHSGTVSATSEPDPLMDTEINDDFETCEAGTAASRVFRSTTKRTREMMSKAKDDRSRSISATTNAKATTNETQKNPKSKLSKQQSPLVQELQLKLKKIQKVSDMRRKKIKVIRQRVNRLSIKAVDLENEIKQLKRRKHLQCNNRSQFIVQEQKQPQKNYIQFNNIVLYRGQ